MCMCMRMRMCGTHVAERARRGLMGRATRLAFGSDEAQDDRPETQEGEGRREGEGGRRKEGGRRREKEGEGQRDSGRRVVGEKHGRGAAWSLGKTCVRTAARTPSARRAEAVLDVEPPAESAWPVKRAMASRLCGSAAPRSSVARRRGGRPARGAVRRRVGRSARGGRAAWEAIACHAMHSQLRALTARAMHEAGA